MIKPRFPQSRVNKYLPPNVPPNSPPFRPKGPPPSFSYSGKPTWRPPQQTHFYKILGTDKCPICSGSGYGWIFKCKACKGSGRVTIVECERCNGSGKGWIFTCKACRGLGEVWIRAS